MTPPPSFRIALCLTVCGLGACSDDAGLGLDAATDAGVPDGAPDVSALGDYEWSRLSGYPGTGGVADHVAIAFAGRLWVMGGHRLTSSDEMNDVWSTQDGVDWTQATAAAAWRPRRYFSGTEFHGAMWIADGVRDNPRARTSRPSPPVGKKAA
jgi:hypothetical protein